MDHAVHKSDNTTSFKDFGAATTGGSEEASGSPLLRSKDQMEKMLGIIYAKKFLLVIKFREAIFFFKNGKRGKPGLKEK